MVATQGPFLTIHHPVFIVSGLNMLTCLESFTIVLKVNLFFYKFSSAFAFYYSKIL
jgi:hypothetical protein